MKKMIEDKKGITLITLSITIVVLLILTSAIVYNLKDELGLERVKNMQNDIENLRDKVETYYVQYGTIPIISTVEYTNINSGIENLKSVNDTGKFYVINLSNLENLTLTYGEDFEKVKNLTTITQENINELEDVYIINESSHNIFYVKGITFDGENYYTDYNSDEKDNEDITGKIKYFDGVKIPDGYVYVSGDNKKNLTIKNEETEEEYYWVVENTKITELPARTRPINGQIDDAIESINRYKGYYQTPGYIILYIDFEEDNWSPIYDKETIYTDANGDTAVIPKGFQVSRIVGSDTIKGGLVARNATSDDRYVWISVPKSIYKSVISNDDYINIEKDMQEYTKDYGDVNCVDNDSDEKNAMLKSVYENNGFWVSQYEIGCETERVNSETELETPVSRKNMYPYNYVTYEQAREQAKKMSYETGRTSDLLYGVQWDLILKFVEVNENKVKSEIMQDSTSWGNYLNSKFSLYGGKYYSNSTWNEVSKSYVKESGSGQLLTTGASNVNKALNIYDIAGNLFEWTQAVDKSKPYSSAVIRGGYFLISGKGENSYNNGAASHSGLPKSIAMNGFGFRVAIY